MRTRLFIDFWNFQINWNKRNDAHIDWIKVPHEFLAKAEALLAQSGQPIKLAFEGVRVYASYDPFKPEDKKLKGWFSTFLDRQVGYSVTLKERHKNDSPVRCTKCKQEISECATCKQKYVKSVEKGIDTAICTDLLALAWENAYDVAILLSSDADHIPAVNLLQTKKFKIINATWKGHGFDLAKSCWASFNVDDVAAKISRSSHI